MGVYFDGFFLFLFEMGHLADLCSKIYEISPPQVKITIFTLLYIYIVLSNHVKLYINIFIFTLTWSVSPKPFTRTTLGLTHFHAISKLFFIHSTVNRPNFVLPLLDLRLGNLNVERL